MKSPDIKTYIQTAVGGAAFTFVFVEGAQVFGTLKEVLACPTALLGGIGAAVGLYVFALISRK